MDARLQRRVQRYGWDKAAAHYEQYWSRQLDPAQRRLLALAALEPGERVLDIACGTGLVTFPAADAVGPSGTVVATDLSEVVVARVAEEAARRGGRQVSSARMDAEALDGPDASFDAALCALGLMYVPDPLRALSEIHRYESAEAACGAAFAGGPVALAYSRFDDQTRAEAEAEYLASIEPWRNGDGYDIPGEFVIARAVRRNG